MQLLRVPIRVVICREEGAWIAHCLEFDLLGDGDTQQEALERLSDAIRIQIEASVDYANPTNLFSPAEGKYFRMFAAGEDLAAPDIFLELEPIKEITIVTDGLRLFSEPEAVAACSARNR